MSHSGVRRGEGPRFEDALLEQLEQWAERNPGELVVGAAGTDSVLTRRDIYNEVRDGTELGRELMDAWNMLAAKHILDSIVD